MHHSSAEQVEDDTCACISAVQEMYSHALIVLTSPKMQAVRADVLHNTAQAPDYGPDISI